MWCEHCFHSPHLPGCPLAPEPKPVYTCENCGEGIFQEDKYIESVDGYLCMHCLEDMSALELLEYIGADIETAENYYD